MLNRNRPQTAAHIIKVRHRQTRKRSTELRAFAIELLEDRTVLASSLLLAPPAPGPNVEYFSFDDHAFVTSTSSALSEEYKEKGLVYTNAFLYDTPVYSGTTSLNMGGAQSLYLSFSRPVKSIGFYATGNKYNPFWFDTPSIPDPTLAYINVT